MTGGPSRQGDDGTFSARTEFFGREGVFGRKNGAAGRQSEKIGEMGLSRRRGMCYDYLLSCRPWPGRLKESRCNLPAFPGSMALKQAVFNGRRGMKSAVQSFWDRFAGQIDPPRR